MLNHKTILVLKRHHAGISVSSGKSNGSYKINYYITSAFIILSFFSSFSEIHKAQCLCFLAEQQIFTLQVMCKYINITNRFFSGY